MKRIAVLAVSVLALASGTGCKKLIQAAADAGPPGAEPKQSTPVETGTKFTKKPLAVGQKRSSDSTQTVKMKVKAAGQEFNVEETEVQKKDEEILELAGDAITKLKVTYTEDDKTSSGIGGGKAKTKATAINGKTYIIQSKDGKVTVHTDKEKPAPKNEEKLVLKDYGSFGKADPMMASMPDRALKDGEDLPELANALRDETLSNQKSDNPKESLTIDGAKVSFKGKDGDNGVFDVSMNLSGGDPQMKIAVPLTGKYSARLADGWPAALDLSGPVSLVLGEKDKAAGVTGEGTVSLKQTYTYK